MSHLTHLITCFLERLSSLFMAHVCVCDRMLGTVRGVYLIVFARSGTLLKTYPTLTPMLSFYLSHFEERRRKYDLKGTIAWMTE